MNRLQFFVKRQLSCFDTGVNNPGTHDSVVDFSGDPCTYYREHTIYEPDKVVVSACIVDVPSVSPSEPPEGVRYYFCASGYYTKNRNRDYCVIYSSWRNVKNYCHWTLTELSYILFALDSDAHNIVIPDNLLNADEHFHREWWSFLRQLYKHKNILPLSEFDKSIKGIVPVNHDTSNMKGLTGQCEYRYYHHARATPYCLSRLFDFVDAFNGVHDLNVPRFYIHRRKKDYWLMKKRFRGCFLVWGLKVLCLEDLSVSQQVNLFNNADCVIGTHGAGLANLVFSRSSAHIIEIVDREIEIMDRESVYPCWQDGKVIPGVSATRTYFHMIAFMRGMHYMCLESKNYSVDLRALELKVSSCLSSVGSGEI